MKALALALLLSGGWDGGVDFIRVQMYDPGPYISSREVDGGTLIEVVGCSPREVRPADKRVVFFCQRRHP